MSYKSAMKKLDEKIVGAGGQANIQFSSIDQRYRSLSLQVTARSDAAATAVGLVAQFNGDTGANYYYEELFAGGGSASGATSSAQTSLLLGLINAATGTANYPGTTSWVLHNYAGTTFYKAGLGNAGRQTNNVAEIIHGVWTSTAAITSILLFPASGNFVQGSVASLYGIL